MKRQRNVNLLLMLVLLVAVGQMAQTIYIPAIADMARDLNVREGAVQSVMGTYLLTYGVSQLFYGPISDRVGRRPVILVGMSIFMLATLVAVKAVINLRLARVQVQLKQADAALKTLDTIKGEGWAAIVADLRG
ncbi:MFS transporter, partial [Escherichia coli]